MPIELPLTLSEQAIEKLQRTMFISAKEAFKQVSEQQSFPPWMTKTEASKYMGVSPNTLNKFIKQGLQLSMVDGVQRISQKEADRFYNEHKI